jgi:dethiobiotin synthetase
VKRYFITGTDTDAGKTYVTRLMAKTLAEQSLRVSCLKPVAAGAVEGLDEAGKPQLHNDDALILKNAANSQLTYHQVNPFCFVEAIAPHIAAKINQQTITLEQIRQHIESLSLKDDICLVEGAGGFLVPLNDNESFADIPEAIGAEVILVVGMKLGCINHALLTVQAIQAKGLTLRGWIANQINPDMEVYQDNLDTLTRMIDAPLIAVAEHNAESLTSSDGSGKSLSQWLL